jgi:hypothetical protein
MKTIEDDDSPAAALDGDGGFDAAGGGALGRLRAVLREQGGMLAGLLAEDGTQPPSSAPAALAASGPRAEAHREEYELLVEAIYEGYLLHYGQPRLLREALEQDLALLAGDQLYALGLARLVRLGDLAAVAELADVITLCALAHGDEAPALAEAVWEAGARAIGWGGCSEHDRAKALARAGSGEALAAMRTAGAR